jgi:hypothetical protein
VIDYLSCEAKAQNNGGRVRFGYRAVARGCFVDNAERVAEIVADASTAGLLDDLEQQDRVLTARVSGWRAEQTPAKAALRQQRHRDGVRDGPLRSVTERAKPSPTGQDRTVGSSSPNGSELVEPRPDDAGTISELFAYWQQRCGHGHAKLTRERQAKLRARLRERYTPAQIRQAIDGAAVAAFVDESGKRHDDLTLICRTGSKLEDFIGRAKTAAPQRQAGNGDRPHLEPKAWLEQFGDQLRAIGWEPDRIRDSARTASGQRLAEAHL